MKMDGFLKMSSTVVVWKKLISRMSPSAQKVYRILQAGKRMRVRDIESKVQYSPRMVRYTLCNLKDAGLVVQINGPWWYYYSINR
jgi:predicted DNA-binding transcriptional regulator